MNSNEKIAAMMTNISSNIDKLEQELKEEYKKLIRISTDFDEIAAQFVVLQRRSLSEPEKEYETTYIVDKLHEQISTTFGTERDVKLIFEAAIAVMDETTTAAAASRN